MQQKFSTILQLAHPLNIVVKILYGWIDGDFMHAVFMLLLVSRSKLILDGNVCMVETPG